MVNQDNVNLVFDIIQASCEILHNETKLKYLDGIVATCENIVSNEIKQRVSDEGEEELLKLYSSLDGVELNSEEIRKAVQLQLLKAFKEQKIGNGEMTPDTIGLLIGYLIDKFYSAVDKVRIFDPVIGTGNLLTSVANYIKSDFELTGIDNNEYMVGLAKANCNLQGHDIDLYFQDTLLGTFEGMDIVVLDPEQYSCIEEDGLSYFPYLAIKRHMKSLKEDGFMFAVIPNDFFLGEESQVMRKFLHQTAHTVGVLELPKTMFTGNPKSILILRKKGKEEKFSDSLIATLPSFTDLEGINQSLIRIDMWFEKINGGNNNGNDLSN